MGIEKKLGRLRKINSNTAYHAAAGTITLEERNPKRRGWVAVVCDGTADMPVAEEAAITAEVSGSRVDRVYDDA